MSVYGLWKTATISGTGKTTGEVDLGRDYDRDYDYLNIILPALTSCTIGLQVAQTSGGAFQTLGISGATTDTTTGLITTTLRLGGYQFIKVVSSVDQTDKSFSVRGWRD